MNSSLFDPNNHVPEISPDDEWGDAEGSSEQTAPGTTALPPRRTVADRPTDAGSTETAPVGLRIESNVARVEITDFPQRLEVQEISGSVIRLDQMAPAPPKVARHVAFHQRPVHEDAGAKLLGEGRHWGVSSRRPTRWIIGAGAAITAIVILSMVLLPTINAPNAARAKPDDGRSNVVIEEKIAGMEAMNLLLTKQPEAMGIFRAFATATIVDEVIPLARDGTALEETIRRHWRPLGISKQWQPAADSSWSIVEVTGVPCALLQGTLPGQSKFSVYFTNEDNRLLLDWKATTAFGTAAFAQLEKSQGDPAEIRGEISLAEFYGATWPEPDYQSYRLVSPDGEIAIWCYTRRGTKQDYELGQLFRKGEITGNSLPTQKITLRLERGPDGALPNQWLIGEMLHIDWVTR